MDVTNLAAQVGRLGVTSIVMMLVVLVIAITVHEYAHCKFADLAGDPTPSYYGRVTLNPLVHLDPIGSIFMVITVLSGFGIGWGRPAPMDPRKMRNPRVDWFTAVAAGPISNLLLATVFAMAFRLAYGGQSFSMAGDPVALFLFYGVMINIALFLFNLIPFGVLDGATLVGLLLPERLRWGWFKFNQGIGTFALFGIIILMQLSGFSILSQPVQWLFAQLTGVRL